MRIMNKWISQFSLIAVMVFSVTACAKTSPPAAEIHPNQTLIQTYVDAYNAHDLAAMAALMHSDIEWINIEGSKQSTITEDKSTLVGELTNYFASNPNSSSTLSDWSVNGKYISAKETVAFTRKDGTQGSQASLSVYELDNNLIRRVWYFPAE